MLGRHLVIALLVGLVWAPRTSSGQELHSGDRWLVWSAPPECPQSDHIEAQLRRWLGDDYDPINGGVKSSASVTWRDNKWAVEVRLRRGGDESTRNVVVGSCTEAADFVALSVALVENPTLLPDRASETVQESPTRRTEDPESEPESDEPALELGPESGPDDEAETAANSADTRFPLLVLSAGVGLRSGIFPGASPLAFARVGVRPGGWRMHLGVASVPYLQHTPELARNPAVFRSLVGQGEVCRYFSSGSVSVGPCLGLEAGALSAREKGGQPTALFWSAVQLLGAAELVWDWGGTFVHVGGQIPFTRPEFLLEGGTVVHRSQAGLETKIGFSVFL